LTLSTKAISIDNLKISHAQVTRPTREDRALIRNARRKVGFVFQTFNLFPHLTVLDNITEAPRVVLKMNRREAEEKAMSLLERVHLGEKARSYPSMLSGGESQRVAIARALAMDPEVLLLDEPTSSLDPELVGEVLDVVAEGMTMLIVTHEMDFARRTSSRVVVMDAGRLIEDAHPEAIFTSPSQPRTADFLNRVLSRRKNA
jgi:ABC-type polar amino acid transport system ATPase subunit